MLLWIAVFLLAVPLCAQDNPMMRRGEQAERDPNEDKYIGKPGHIQAGKDLYMVACSGCHGPSGEGGRGPNLILGRRGGRGGAKRLFNSIKNGVPGSDMPPFALPEEQLWQLTAFVRNLSAPAYETNVPGDPQNGETLFFGKAGCSNCHLIRGRGGFLGPDLSNAGLANYLVELREGLLEPNKRITKGFDPVRVTTKAGEVIEGVAKNYTNYSMQVADAKGNLYLFRSEDLREFVLLEKTWMPGDFAQRFSESEIQDLLAFLSRQATRIPAPRGEEEKTERDNEEP